MAKKTEAKKRGRPLAGEELRATQVGIRLADAEYQEIAEAARADDRQVSDFIRVTVLRAVRGAK